MPQRNGDWGIETFLVGPEEPAFPEIAQRY